MKRMRIRVLCFMISLVCLFLAMTSCNTNQGKGEQTMETDTTPATEGITTAPPFIPEVPEVTEYATFESERGTLMAPVIDIQTALNNLSYDYNRIKEEMKILADMGFTRVYFVVATNGYGMMCWPKWSNEENRYVSGYQFILENEQKLRGNVNRLYFTACKNAGMEAFAVYKPYEGGGTQTVPESVSKLDESLGNAWIKTLGGYIYHTDPFIAEHPEYRIQRKIDMELHAELPVTSIEIDFLLSGYSAGKTLKSSGVSESTVKEAAKKFTLWVSDDNGTYVPYTGNSSVSFSNKSEQTKNMSGSVIGTYNYVTMQISGLSLSYEDAKYLAISFENSASLHTIPYHTFTLYNGNTKLSSTVTSFSRYPANAGDKPKTHEWGNESSKPVSGSLIAGIKVSDNGTVTGVKKGSAALNGAESFYQWGFAFGWIYDSEFALYANSAVYGIARGTIEYVPGGLCEGYEEVRAYWLSQVKQLLEYGADGIDIRPESHSTMAVDYTNYGYNQPIVDKYRELYGVDIQTAEADYMKVAKIRGDFFIEFLEDAAELTRSYDALFATHLVASYENPKLSTNVFCVGHFTDPKTVLDWKRVVDLCDEITIKDNTYSSYKSELAKEIRTYAQSKGKLVWVHAYLQQGNTNNKEYVTAADKDGLNDGILLYEMTFDSNYSPKLVAEVESILDSLYCKRVTHKIKE